MRVIDFNKVNQKLRGSEFDDGYIIEQVVNDVCRLGFQTATKYLLEFSPSKLGQLGLTGLRKLAKIKRDNPKKFWELIEFFPEEEADRII